jgi:hypothetical protein
MTQVQILLTDNADNTAMECQITTSNVNDKTSQSNIMAAFLGKYWEVLCTSASLELTQATAEANPKPIEPAPLQLLKADGTGVYAATEKSE